MNEKPPIAFTYPKEYFNITDTLECGQIFRYRRLPDGAYAVYSLDKYAELSYNGCDVEVRTQDKDYFWNFFDLDADYESKARRISALSPLMSEAVAFGKGIRILNQQYQADTAYYRTYMRGFGAGHAVRQGFSVRTIACIGVC